MPSQESELRQIREILGQQTVLLARLEERFNSQDTILDDMVRVLRGDGNGQAGLIMRLASQSDQILMLRDRVAKCEHAIESVQNTQSTAGIARWKIVVALIGALATVLASVAALLTALLK